MTDKDAGIWLRINSAMKEEFKSWLSFTDDDAANIRSLVSHIRWMKRNAAEAAAKAEREAIQDKRHEKRLRRFECPLDAYDYDARTRAKRILRRSAFNQ